MTCAVLDQLIELSHRLGDPARDYAILAEGNCSARIDDETFWVKASGASQGTAGPAQFLRISFDRALAMLEDEGLTDDAVRERLIGARVEGPDGVLPSVETVFHAVCLQLEGVDFVGHTHPTDINMITCSQSFEQSLSGRLFPDEIVLCGPEPVLVPYVDPGLPLARAVRRRVSEFIARRQERPKVIYLQSHGFAALGATPKQIEDTTEMAVKAARILVGTYRLGGPVFLPEHHVNRIHTRPDEHYRQRLLGQWEGGERCAGIGTPVPPPSEGGG